jgi:hypothetical protein
MKCVSRPLRPGMRNIGQLARPTVRPKLLRAAGTVHVDTAWLAHWHHSYVGHSYNSSRLHKNARREIPESS